MTVSTDTVKAYSIAILLFVITNAVNAQQTFYSPQLQRYEFVAKNCTNIINNNIGPIRANLDRIQELYNLDNWSALGDLIDGINLTAFDDALRNCSTAYKFNGPNNYFLEAHINISAILHSITSRNDFVSKPSINSEINEAHDTLKMISDSALYVE